MEEKTIRVALLKGERVTLECKRAKAEVPKSVWATYSAFANTIGGADSLLGVYENIQEKDTQKRYQIIGVDNPMNSLKNIQKHISKRKELGLIRRIGSPRLGYWEIVG